METYYKKEKGRYKPIGVFGLERELPDGIWLIKSNIGSTSYKNLTYYMGKCDTNNVKSYAEAICNEDLLIDAIGESLKTEGRSGYGIPYLVGISKQELANRIINFIYKNNGL